MGDSFRHEKKFVAIAGNIGSGKTTLTELLANRYDWDAHFEAVSDNPYLEDFYSDMERWSLQLQVFFLSKRFQTHKHIVKHSRSAIQDRSIYEDRSIFARSLYEQGKMAKRDYENYMELFDVLIEALRPPDLLLYIRRSVKCIQDRILERGRAFEKDIPEAYLQHLHQCYEDWVKGYDFGKVLIIDADDLDAKNRPEDLNYVCGLMEKALSP